MQIEIWSDVACPWCAVGKRRFETALERFAHRDEVELRWRSFELDPTAPREVSGDYVDRLAAKYGRTRAQAQEMIDHMTQVGASEGIDFHFEMIRAGNTFDAHRLLHLAADRGIQDAVKERFLIAYLSEGVAIGRPEELQRLAVEAGLDPDTVAEVLGGDDYASEVRADEEQAHAFGITGVPFFVIDRRFGISGAQPAELILEGLQRAWRERSPIEVLDGTAGDAVDGADCADGSCAV